MARRWLIVRCTHEMALLAPMLTLLVTAVASAQQVPSDHSARLEQPVIRASELQLKEATTVAAVSGVVHITRRGAILNPSPGDPIEAGDLMQITPNSSLTLRSARGLVTLTNRDGEWFRFID